MRRQNWKDDLLALLAATGAQFAIFRAADWAKANAGTDDLARRLTDNHFFFAREIVTLVIGYFLIRLIRSVLSFRGLPLGEWLKSSFLVLFLGLGFLFVAHVDQILKGLAQLTGADVLVQAAHAFETGFWHDVLSQYSVARLGIDVLGLVILLLALRMGKPGVPLVDRTMGRGFERGGDNIKLGESYLKAGNVKAAKKAFKKAGAHARLAALELREGNLKAAASLYETAGDAYAWEAAKAWETAGETAKADTALKRAVDEAQRNSRWDLLAEIAEATGDNASLAEASRRLAELRPPGPGRTGLWKRAGDAFLASGKKLEAAESYRAAGEFLLAAEAFAAVGKPAEAAADYERAGELARASQSFRAAGNAKLADELFARDAEARGDVVVAAEAWNRSGNTERAAALFERRGLNAEAAKAWMDAGRPDRAAPLFQKAGELAASAAAFEAAGEKEKAATLYREAGQPDKAAGLFRTAGRWFEAAQMLEASGSYDEAASAFLRSGKGLDAARCALKAGHREKAWEHLASARRNESGVSDFFLELAQAHLDAGEAKDAVHVLRELLGPSSVTKENERAQLVLVKALAAAGDAGEAAQRYARLVEFDPQYRQHVGLAQATGAETRHVPPPRPTPLPAPVPTPLPASAAAAAATAAPFVTAASPIVSAPPAAPSSRPPSSGAMPAVQRAPSGTFPVPTSGTMPGVNVNASGSFPTIDAPELRYEIISELGRGGMGVVHKALDRKLDRYVALKILPWQMHGDETAMRYFEREAKAIAAMKHPNIVALYDFGQGFGSLYLAMEFLEGPNLQSLLKADPERVKKRWREWFVQATRGIAAAHSKGLLHRDLKPANLMLDEHGTLRILDFGLARPESDSGMTSKLIGTPAFLPPEVLRGETPSPASDVYSLGATFYTLATGRWPYIGEDILVARLERDPDDPSPYAPFLNKEEVDILMRSLARFRPERFPDAGELLAALLALEG